MAHSRDSRSGPSAGSPGGGPGTSRSTRDDQRGDKPRRKRIRTATVVEAKEETTPTPTPSGPSKSSVVAARKLKGGSAKVDLSKAKGKSTGDFKNIRRAQILDDDDTTGKALLR